jgi:alpha-tubulin suppressor-like RCC1 family protein
MRRFRLWHLSGSTLRAALVLATLAASGCEAVTGTPREEIAGPWASLSAGASFVCGTTDDMRAYCWGDNSAGQLGVGSTSGPESCSGAPCSTRPVAVIGDLRFTTVSAGGAHACGLTRDGVAYCWGANNARQLGASTSESCSSAPCSTRPVRVSGSLTWTAITAGSGHTCALTSSGRAYCWGSNFWGQVGNGSRSETNGTPTPTPVVGELTFQLLSAGVGHTCGLVTDGRAFCWGAGRTGQLGTGGQPLWSERPAAVAGGLTFAVIAAGGGHTCAVTAERRAYCWGSNAFDQLGVGPTTLGPENCTATIHPCSKTPRAVIGRTRFVSVSPGPEYTCAIAVDRFAYCWGSNWWGQLGSPVSDRTNVPTRVDATLRFASLSTGGTATVAGTTGITCGVTVNGAAYCWGSNRSGELGSGSRTAADNDPPGRRTPTLVALPAGTKDGE